MKRKIFFASGAVLLAAAVSLSVYVNNETNSMTEFFNANVEALAACEIQNKQGEIIFECVGNEGKCDASKLGYTLICSGTENAR